MLENSNINNFNDLSDNIDNNNNKDSIVKKIETNNKQLLNE